MIEGPFAIALEGGLALLLAAVLYFCWRLDRKLAALRAGQDGVRAAALELKEAAAHAEAAVRGLRATAADTARDLQARIDDARGLAERLGMGRPRAETAQRAGARGW
ncbi:MAG: DUF6468 domain-containing protein [Hyphomonadaceae bacterium]